MSQKPTMNDVARLAGVGTMTVSRVLNGSANVSPETAERVKSAIHKLKYRPNEMARALRAMKSKSIGVIVPYLYDPFFATCAHAINVVAKEHGYLVVLTTSDEDADTEYEEARLMVQRHVEGLIVIPASGGPSSLTGPEFDSMHVVTVDRPVPGVRFDSVLVENEAGANLAVQHLIAQHGHRRILCLGMDSSLYTMNARFEGYRKAMIANRLAPEPMIACNTPEAAHAIVKSALQETPRVTAFFTANNLATRYLLAALLENGIDIPGEVALIGFDDVELADILPPKLTVVRQSAHDLGRVAAEMLFDRLKSGTSSSKGKRTVLPVDLILRRSCGCELSANAESLVLAKKESKTA
jgi:LacI family transcriptional regulator